MYSNNIYYYTLINLWRKMKRRSNYMEKEEWYMEYPEDKMEEFRDK